MNSGVLAGPRVQSAGMSASDRRQRGCQPDPTDRVLRVASKHCFPLFTHSYVRVLLKADLQT